MKKIEHARISDLERVQQACRAALRAAAKLPFASLRNRSFAGWGQKGSRDSGANNSAMILPDGNVDILSTHPSSLHIQEDKRPFGTVCAERSRIHSG